MKGLRQTVAAVFANEQRGRQAIDTLRSEGFQENEINLVSRDDKKPGANLSQGTIWGAGIGTAGGLMASAGALAVPGIGPLLALGPIGAALGSAAIGGLAGALVDYGIPQQAGRQFEQDIKRGEALALVETDNASRAAEILRREGARQVDTYSDRHHH